MVYRPPTRVTTKQFAYVALVTQADPQWARDKYWAEEYRFQNKSLFANPYVRGANNSNSNTYPVGVPFGGQDPLVVAARPMYAGTPDGKGWA